MVPVSTITVIVIDIILGILVPVALSWFLIKKYKISLSTVLIGAATFIVFALVLESIVHNIVLNGPRGEAIKGNTFYYALYGGLMAGLFEEVGRYISMKFLLIKEPTKVSPAIAYGVGHGGVEMLIIFGIGMISTLMMALMVNNGQINEIMTQVPANAVDQLNAQIEQVKTASSASYLLGLWERASALIMQISLSILVWTAVRKGGKWMWLFPAAILIHALVDGTLVMLQKSISAAALETICFAEALVLAAVAFLIARKAFSNSEELLPE